MHNFAQDVSRRRAMELLTNSEARLPIYLILKSIRELVEKQLSPFILDLLEVFQQTYSYRDIPEQWRAIFEALPGYLYIQTLDYEYETSQELKTLLDMLALHVPPDRR
jgi:hypothetical protein